MDMMEIRRRVLMGRKVDDKPWLDYPLSVFEFNKQPLICSDGTQWEWKDNGTMDIGNARGLFSLP